MAELTLYDLEKQAWQDVLALPVDRYGNPLTITYMGNSKPCISRGVRKQITWQTIGFVPETTRTVEMLDDDFAEFCGIEEPQQSVIVDWMIYQVVEIFKDPTSPVVHLELAVSK